MPRYHITPSLPNQYTTNALVFDNSLEMKEELTQMGYKAYYLDCEEVVWVKDSPLMEYVETISIVNRARGFEIPEKSFIYEKGNDKLGQYILKQEGHAVIAPININENGDYVFRLNMGAIKHDSEKIGQAQLGVEDAIILWEELECEAGTDHIQLEFNYELTNVDQVLVMRLFF